MTVNNERRAWNEGRARELLRAAFDTAVASADPRLVLARHLPQRPTGRCIVIGAGRSAASMAAALEEAWPDVPVTGFVVTRHGHTGPTRCIKVVEAAHPVADADHERVGTRLLALVHGLDANDLVLVLVSGGGATLLADAVARSDERTVGRALLAAGATAAEIGRVTAYLRTLQAGRLAQASRPARMVTLAIGDEAGMATPAAGGRDEIAALVARLGATLPAAVMAVLQRQVAPKPHAWKPDIRLIASPMLALRAAAAVAQRAGISPLILGDALTGESREVGTVMAGIAESVRRQGHPLPGRVLLLSGGRTTVTLAAEPTGRGGRNTEFLLGMGLALSGQAGIWAMAAATGGSDGNGDAAGAFIVPDTLERARNAGLDPGAVLSAHDSYRLFDATGDLIRTGRTLIDIDDFRATLIA